MQALYEVAADRMGFVDWSPALQPTLDTLAPLLGYEPPRNAREKQSPPRFALLRAGVGRVLLQTTPTGVRGSGSFTHLWVPPTDCLTVDLLCGWRHPFWRGNPEGGTLTGDRFPWDVKARRAVLDRQLDVWLRQRDNQALVRFVVTAHRQLEPDGRIFLAAEPEDVFWSLYGAVSLLPESLAQHLTFSTFEANPLARGARVVGTWWSGPGNLDPVCRTAGNASCNRLAGEPVPERAGPEADLARLLLRMRLSGEVESLRTEELLQLSGDPIGVAHVADRPEVFARLVREQQLPSALALMRAGQSPESLGNALIPLIRSALAANDGLALQRILAFVPEMPASVHIEICSAIRELPAPRDVSLFGSLLLWLGTEGVAAPVLTPASPSVAQAVVTAERLPANLVAAWLLAQQARVPAATHLQALADADIRDELRRSLPKPEQRGEYLQTILDGLADREHGSRLLAAIGSDLPVDAVDVLVIRAFRAGLIEPLDVLARFRQREAFWSDAWPVDFRRWLVLGALRDTAAQVVEFDPLRRIVGLLGRGVQLGDELAEDRWDALRLLEPRRVDAALPVDPEPIARALQTLSAWKPGCHRSPWRACVVAPLVRYVVTARDESVAIQALQRWTEAFRTTAAELRLDWLEELLEVAHQLPTWQERADFRVRLTLLARAEPTSTGQVERHLGSLPRGEWTAWESRLRESDWLVRLVSLRSGDWRWLWIAAALVAGILLGAAGARLW